MSKRVIVLLIAAVLAVFTFSACEVEDTGDGQKKETKTVQENYDGLVDSQPAHTMKYSPTRETKNFWIDTWGQKGKTSYVYLMNNDGKVIGYYVFDGLPVNYCTSLVVPYQIKVPDVTGDNTTPVVVPAPSVDGTFGANCDPNTYYGKDATTGAFIQYTAGMGINPLLYDQPLAPGVVGGAPNLGEVK